MPPTSDEDRVKFLISCIRHSQGGKIDFDGVAQEMEIPTKAAAYKRYERLLKAHSMNVSGEPLSEVSTATSPAKTKKARSASVKAEAEANGTETADSEPPAKKARKRKTAAAAMEGSEKKACGNNVKSATVNSEGEDAEDEA